MHPHNELNKQEIWVRLAVLPDHSVEPVLPDTDESIWDEQPPDAHISTLMEAGLEPNQEIIQLTFNKLPLGYQQRLHRHFQEHGLV